MFNYDFDPNAGVQNPILEVGRGAFKISKIETTDRDGQQLMSSDNSCKRVSVVLVCKDISGRQGIVRQSISEKQNWLLRQLVESVGHPELYNQSGRIDLNSLVGLTGFCDIGYKPAEGGYKERSIIDRFIAAGESRPSSSEVASTKDFNDEIPF